MSIPKTSTGPWARRPACCTQARRSCRAAPAPSTCPWCAPAPCALPTAPPTPTCTTAARPASAWPPTAATAWTRTARWKTPWSRWRAGTAPFSRPRACPPSPWCSSPCSRPATMPWWPTASTLPCAAWTPPCCSAWASRWSTSRPRATIWPARSAPTPAWSTWSRPAPALRGAGPARPGRRGAPARHAVATDNTWSGGWFYQPLEHGANLSIQAATKYIAGHSDVMQGIVITDGPALSKKISTAYEALGLTIGADDAYLALRGLRTLPVRLAQHQRHATEIAQWRAAAPGRPRLLPGPAVRSRPCAVEAGLQRGQRAGVIRVCRRGGRRCRRRVR